MPSCAIARPQKRNEFFAIATTSAGVPATTIAVTAVMARPTPIQPYTLRRNEPTRSATASGVATAAFGETWYSAMCISLRTAGPHR
jgi:hypothetical protein